MFKGFSKPDGFTQTPNEFFDLLIQDELSKSEIRLLAFMIRNTFGWRKDGFCLVFSHGEMANMLGTDRSQMSRTVKGLIEKGIIERKEIGGEFRYRLKLEDDEEMPWEMSVNWKRANDYEQMIVVKKSTERMFAISATKIKNVRSLSKNQQNECSLSKNQHPVAEKSTNTMRTSLEPQGFEAPLNKEVINKNMYVCMGDEIAVSSESSDPVDNSMIKHRKVEQDKVMVAVLDLAEKLKLSSYAPEFYAMLLKQFPKQLDAEIVNVAYQVFWESGLRMYGERWTPIDLRNPTGFLYEAYKEAISRWKLERYRKKMG